MFRLCRSKITRRVSIRRLAVASECIIVGPVSLNRQGANFQPITKVLLTASEAGDGVSELEGTTAPLARDGRNIKRTTRAWSSAAAEQRASSMDPYIRCALEWGSRRIEKERRAAIFKTRVITVVSQRQGNRPVGITNLPYHPTSRTYKSWDRLNCLGGRERKRTVTSAEH